MPKKKEKKIMSSREVSYNKKNGTTMKMKRREQILHCKRGRPSFCSKGGLPVPNNKFQIAFGDAYCIACIRTAELAKMKTKIN